MFALTSTIVECSSGAWRNRRQDGGAIACSASSSLPCCWSFSGTAAAAAERYTTPTATDVSGSCTVELPCRIDLAVNGAGDGDVVNVAPGTYQVDTELDLDSDADMHGLAGEPAPLLIGDEDLDDELLTFEGAGTLRHLSLKSTAPGQTRAEAHRRDSARTSR